MNNKNRVLAYQKAFELTNDELLKISGGSTKLTVDLTYQVTGSYPGNVDHVTDQTWD